MADEVLRCVERLSAAVRSGNEGRTRWLLRELEGSSNLAGSRLHTAVEAGGEYLVKLLNVSDGQKRRPLHYAVEWGSVPIIERLLEHGADIDAADGDSQTPLHRAVCCKKETVVNLLLDRGAQVNLLDSYRNSPLHYATQWGRVAVIERLLELGAYVDPINSDNLTPLLIAAEGERGEAVISLLRHGADANAKRTDRSTALHSAAQWADEAVVENLIYYGADPKACDRWNIRPLPSSILRGRPEVTRILLENYGYGSDLCFFLTSKMRRWGATSEILRLHFLDLEVRNMWVQAHNGDRCSCRSTLKDVIVGDFDGEIKKMKRRSIIEGITLYDLITKSKNQMVRLVRNTSLLEALASVDVAKDFPVFARLFTYKWEAALSRGRLIQDGVSALGSLMIASVTCRVNVSVALGDALRSAGCGWVLDFLKVSPETPTADFLEGLKQLDYLLPVAVVENVLSNLSDTDLRSLISAARLTN